MPLNDGSKQPIVRAKIFTPFIAAIGAVFVGSHPPIALLLFGAATLTYTWTSARRATHIIGVSMLFLIVMLIGVVSSPDKDPISGAVMLFPSIVSGIISLLVVLIVNIHWITPIVLNRTEKIYRLVGVCEGILGDDEVTTKEARFLRSWIEKGSDYKGNKRINMIVKNIEVYLSDGHISIAEASELRTQLSEFCDHYIGDLKTNTKLRTVLKQNEQKKLAAKRRNTHSPDLTVNQKRKRKSSTKKTPVSTGNKSVLKSGDVVEIMYQDSHGDLSEREVVFQSISTKSGRSYLNGICKTRNAYRTFRIDRIITAIDVKSGEYIDEPESFFV